MTKSPQKNVPDMGIELGAACMPSELASDQATMPLFDRVGENVIKAGYQFLFFSVLKCAAAFIG